jgi:hypothetical protein
VPNAVCEVEYRAEDGGLTIITADPPALSG